MFPTTLKTFSRLAFIGLLLMFVVSFASTAETQTLTPTAPLDPPDPNSGEATTPQNNQPLPEFTAPPIFRHDEPSHTDVAKGERKFLFVLVDFPDLPGLFTGAEWQEKFFGGQGLNDYYQEVSYGQLSLSGDFVGISDSAAKVNDADLAYVRLPNPITYYADGNSGRNIGVGYFPKNSGGVVYHALLELERTGFDFSPYADPDTKIVENLAVVFAGSSAASTRDVDNSLRATAYYISFAGLGSEFENDSGFIFDRYVLCPDQKGNLTGDISNIGTCAHEIGHLLGMADLYDYSSKSSGIGFFGVMGYGLYGFESGKEPFHFSAFPKIYFDWVEPTVITAEETIISLNPVEDHPEIIKLYPNNNLQSDEYFLLENRQEIGYDRNFWYRGLCPGLLIWHIDGNIVDDPYWFRRVNSKPPTNFAPPNPGIIIVEADGEQEMITEADSLNYGECEDTWKVGQTWDQDSVGATTLWNGSDTGLSVSVLSETDGVLELQINIDSKTIYLPFMTRD